MPRWSRNSPPHAANPPIIEPSVLTFNHGAVGAFHKTIIISLTLRQWGESAKELRKARSDCKHLPLEILPDIAIKEWIRTLAECKVGVTVVNRNEFLTHQIVCNLCKIDAKKMSDTWEWAPNRPTRDERVYCRAINNSIELNTYPVPKLLGKLASKKKVLKRCSEVSSIFKHKLQIDTTVQPRLLRLSSVGILPWWSLQ